MRIGDCAGLLLATPEGVELRVGQEIDLHMTTDAPNGAGLTTPMYRLPPSPNDAILRAVAQSDNGTTGRFVAVAQGVLVLVTTGRCTDPAPSRQTEGACPVLEVTVTR